MKHWEILGLTPPADEKQIRAAYAKILKTIDQDQEPERFIALREAFARAKADVQHQANAPRYDTVDAVPVEHVADPESPLVMDEPPPQTASPEMAARHEDPFSHQLERLLNAMRQQDWSDDVYQQFSHVLTELPRQPLGLQMAAHDQLAYALALALGLSETGDASPPSLLPFLEIWRVMQGHEHPAVNAHPALHALHIRLEHMASQETLMAKVPSKYRPAMQALYTTQDMQYGHMLRLAWSRDPFIRQYLKQDWQHYPITNIHQSLNVPLVHYLHHFWRSWPTMLMVFLACFILLGAMFPHEALQGALLGKQTLDDLSNTGFSIPREASLTAVSAGMALLWSAGAQSQICAWVVRRLKARQRADRIAMGWFYGALLLAVGLPYLPPLAQEILLGLWLFVGGVVMGYGRYNRPSLFDYLSFAIRIKADRACLIAGTWGLFAVLTWTAAKLGDFSGAAPSCVLLAFLPFTLLLNIHYFRDVFKPQHYLLLMHVVISSIVVGVFVVLNHIVSDIQVIFDIIEKLELAVYLLIISWAIWIPAPKLPYGIKYGTYLTVILLPLISTSALMASAWSAYMLFNTLRHDFARFRKQVPIS